MTKLFEIFHEIPTPTNRSSRRGLTDSFKKLKVGDCIHIPYEYGSSIYGIANNLRIKVQSKFNKKTGIVKVWRIE